MTQKWLGPKRLEPGVKDPVTREEWQTAVALELKNASLAQAMFANGGAANMTAETGAVLGIVVGLLVVGLQFLIGVRGIVGVVIGVFVAISLGRYVGAGIANKVQQPVSP